MLPFYGRRIDWESGLSVPMVRARSNRDRSRRPPIGSDNRACPRRPPIVLPPAPDVPAIGGAAPNCRTVAEATVLHAMERVMRFIVARATTGWLRLQCAAAR